jgi:sarcosine/dimethylglycine N-methyltransferase
VVTAVTDGARNDAPSIAEEREAYRRVFDSAVSRLMSAAWGGNLHLGLFAHADEPLAPAQRRVKDRMAVAAAIGPGTRVIEVACGVGGTARYLARECGARVHATNIAEAQLAEARDLTLREELGDRITFDFGDFHQLDAPSHAFDCWWCQEALLYAADKRRVLEEAVRVVRPGGRIVFTDLLLTRAMPSEDRERFAAELKAPPIWAIEDWDALLTGMHLRVLERQDWSGHVALTFARVAEALKSMREEFAERIGRDAVEGMEHRITLQLEAARAGRLGWCFYSLAA